MTISIHDRLVGKLTRIRSGAYSPRDFIIADAKDAEMAEKAKDVLFNPLFNDNPIALQILGICSALAVTTKMETSITMSLAVIFVLSMSNTAVSLIRNIIPNNIRIIVQMTIIASLVIVVDELLKAYDYETSKKLSVFVGLIITNCIVMGRAEAFAMKEKPFPSFIDGLGNGLGYSFILIVVAVIRELFGAGTLMGVEIFPLVSNGGWYPANNLLLLPPSSFIIIGLLIWLIRVFNKEQVEEKDFNLSNCGVHTMDIMRMESGFLHWGHDISPEENQYEANLDFTISYKKNIEFIGKKALEDIKLNKLNKKFVMLTLKDSEPGKPLMLHDEPIYLNEKIIGRTTSANYSFSYNKNLAFGYVSSDYTKELNDGNLEIEIEKIRYKADYLDKKLNQKDYKSI